MKNRHLRSSFYFSKSKSKLDFSLRSKWQQCLVRDWGGEKRTRSVRFSPPSQPAKASVISMERSDWEISFMTKFFKNLFHDKVLLKKWNEKYKTRFNTPPRRVRNSEKLSQLLLDLENSEYLLANLGFATFWSARGQEVWNFQHSNLPIFSRRSGISANASTFNFPVIQHSIFPIFHHSIFPSFQSSNLPFFHLPNLPFFPSSIVELSNSSIFPIFHFSPLPIIFNSFAFKI